jgi:hypothetical protein
VRDGSNQLRTAELAIGTRNGAGPMILGREYQGGVCGRAKNLGAKIQADLASLNLEAPDEEARTGQAAKENTRDQDHGGIEPRSSTVVGRQRTRVAKTAGK